MHWTFDTTDLEPNNAHCLFTHTTWRRAALLPIHEQPSPGLSTPSEQISRWLADQDGSRQSLVFALVAHGDSTESLWLGARGRAHAPEAARERARSLADALSEVLDPQGLFMAEPCHDPDFGEAWASFSPTGGFVHPQEVDTVNDSDQCMLETVSHALRGLSEPWSMVLEITPSQISPSVRSDARRTHDQLMSRALREMWHQRSFMPDVRPLMDLLHHAQQARYEAESAQLRIAMHGARPGPVLRHHLEHIVSQTSDWAFGWTRRARPPSQASCPC